MPESINGENLNSLRLNQAKAVSDFERNYSNRPSYDGMVDPLGEIRLRLAIIDNPDLERKTTDRFDPVDPSDIINLNTGQVCLRWIGLAGGVIRPGGTTHGGSGGDYINEPVANQVDPATRDWTNWQISSRREQVELTSPFIWSDDYNWCGFNYIPPVGSIVVVGFKKHGLPIILGYINNHVKVTKPVLRPGEICIKGYGKNYVHWRDSNKIDMKAWSTAGDVDLDYINAGMDKPNVKDPSEMWIGLNAHDNRIDIKAICKEDFSQITLTPKDTTIITSGGGDFSKYFQTKELVQIDTKTFKVNAATLIELKSAKITQN